MGQQALEILKQTYGEQYQSIFGRSRNRANGPVPLLPSTCSHTKPGLAIKGKNGKASDQVIVKILRPGVEKVIEKDLTVMYLFAGMLQKHWSRSKQFRPLEVIREYDGTIHAELDLRQEAANCSQMGANFEHSDLIYVPCVYWDYTYQNVMVMERIYGTSVRDVETLRELGHDLKQLAADGVETFFQQAF